MALFNLSWFKKNKKEEPVKTPIQEVVINNSDSPPDPIQQIGYKPYKRARMVNDILTVVLNDGGILTKSGATVDEFLQLRQAVSEKDILYIMRDDDVSVLEKISEEDKEIDYNTVVDVASFPDFESRNDSVYMTGVDRSIPALLLSRFGEILKKYGRSPGWEDKVLEDVEYTSLKKFWLKCCLNPNAQSAEDLYVFLSHHNMKIDRHGNFFAYRNVVRINGDGDTGLPEIISKAYNNVRAVWKKKPSNFRIEEVDGEYSLHKITAEPVGKIVGNLETLYQELPKMQENRYTDAHTRTMDYRVGEIASIPRDECDDNNSVNCSMGLHAASKKYDYSSFGDTPILMIINPMDAVAVPINEVGKLRVSRFFFAMTLDKEDKYILDDDAFDVTDLGDIFEERCLESIEEHVHNSFAEEVKRHTLNIPNMNNDKISNISNMLRKMNEAISNRIVQQ